jgi:hypothetical protein
MLKADQKHQKSGAEFLSQSTAEQHRRLEIEDYKNAEYVAAEVLVTIIRARYGKDSRVFEASAAVLHKRMLVLVDRYFAKNPQWLKVLKSSSEHLNEAVMYAWQILLEDTDPTSFAEIRFLTWVQARANDYLRSQLAKKNRALSLETLTVQDEEGEEKNYAHLLEDDEENTPEAILEREELKELLKKKGLEMDRDLRHAVYLRLECEYEWTVVAKLLDCSVPTARKYYNTGLAQLTGA